MLAPGANTAAIQAAFVAAAGGAQSQIAQTTARKYDAAMEKFQRYLHHELSITDLAAVDAVVVAGYAHTLQLECQDEGNSGAAVTDALAAIAHRFRTLNLPSPTEAPLVQQLRRQAAATRTTRPLRRDPLEVQHLRALHDVVFAQQPLQLPALVTLTAATRLHYGCLRWSCLASVGFHADCIQFGPGDSSVTLVVAFSKTSRTGRRVTLPAVAEGPCPVRLLRRLFAAGGYGPLPSGPGVPGPLMRAWRHGGGGVSLVAGKALPRDTFNNHLAQLAESAGIRARLTSHSGRIGFASEAAAAGDPVTSIMGAGGWRSERAAKGYMRPLERTPAPGGGVGDAGPAARGGGRGAAAAPHAPSRAPPGHTPAASLAGARVALSLLAAWPRPPPQPGLAPAPATSMLHLLLHGEGGGR